MAVQKIYVFVFFLLILLPTRFAQAQSGTCSGAEVFCGSNAYSFPTSTGTTSEPGPCYSCLSSQPNPAWYFMQVGNSGNLVITMFGMAPGEPPDSLDIDFICWGPFTSPTGACLAGLTCDKVVDCSYSGFSFETCIIPNAVSGEFYMLLITNFSNNPGNITFQQTNSGQTGSGSTNCNIVVDCSLLALSPVPTVCDPGNATFDINGVAEFTNPPTTGTLTIKDVTTVPPVQVVFNPPFSSPMGYTLPDIPCDGQVHSIYAVFSEASNPCEISATCQAPVAPCPSGVLSGGGPICANGSNQATISIAVTGAPGPYNFVYALDGINQPPVTNYSGPIPYTFTTTVPGIYSMVSTSNGNCSGSSSGSATVSIVSTPSAPVSAPGPFYSCGTGPVSLSVVPVSGVIVNWYNSETGGTMLGTGNNYTTSPLTTTTTFYAEAETVVAGCKSAERTPVIAEIRPIPLVVSPVQSLDVCSGATWSVPLTSTPPGAEFFWTASDNPAGSVTGFSEAGFGTLISELLTTTGVNQGIVTYEVMGVLNQCSGPILPIQITVHPKPQPSFVTSSSVVCEGTTNITYATQPSMNGYSWNISSGGTILSGSSTNTVTVAWNTPGSGTQRWIEVNYTDGFGCTADEPVRMFVTVNPIPDIQITPLTQTICSGQTSQIHLESTVPGTTTSTVFNWNCNAPASISPGTLNGTGDINQAFTNTGTAPGDITFTVTATASGCSSQTIGNLITVNPFPSVIFPSLPVNPQEICSGTQATPIPLSSNLTVSGVSYSWTAIAYDPVNPTDLITGFTTPGSGNTIPGENILSLLLSQGVIKYTVIPTYTSGVACPGHPATYQILVNPSPTVNLTPSNPTGQSICSGGQSVPITFLTNVQPTVYTWVASQISGVSGAVLNGTTDFIPAQSLTVTGNSSGFITYKVTPIYQGSSTFTCPGADSYSTIFVNPLPNPSVTGKSLVCELQPDEKYNTPFIAEHSYNWNVTGASAIVNSTSNEVTVTWGAYINSPGTISVTEIINATGCTRTSTVMQVVLQQRPIPTLTGPTLNVCESSGGHLYFTESNMTNYSWSVNGGNITSGGGAGNDFVMVTWGTSGAASVEVNYSNALQCRGFPSKILPITVNPLPATQITISPGPECEGTTHSYAVSPDPGSTFTWNVTPATLGIVTEGQGTDQVTIQWNYQGNAVLQVLGVNNTTQCSASGSIPLTIRPKPNPALVPCFDRITTSLAKPFPLKGATPFITGQGQFSGNRVSLNAMTGMYEFNPSGASAGTYSVFYSLTNNYGCETTTAPITITVLNNTFNCGGDYTDPRDGQIYRTGMLAGKCWLIENLKYGNILSGNPLAHQTDNCIAERYCNTTDPTCTQFGGLYQWDELMDYTSTPGAKGLCPPEWHIPTESEWQSLIDNLINGISSPHANGAVAPELKDLYLANGFRALLSGYLYNNNHWSFTSGNPTAIQFWTSTPDGSDRAVARGLNKVTASISRYKSGRGNAFPVRCIKD